MPKTIIADTSCFILLANINEFILLQKLYGHVVTTPDIAAEFGDEFPEWIIIETVKDSYQQKVLEMEIDKGEASALALALEIPDSTVIVDDYLARKMAEKLGINYTGTLGVIIRAKMTGIIASIKPLLAKIRKTDFRLSEEIEKEALRQADEE